MAKVKKVSNTEKMQDFGQMGVSRAGFG